MVLKVIGPEYVRAKILEKIRDMEKNYLSFQKAGTWNEGGADR